MEFVKIAELSGEDRTKLREYWSHLWGGEFASALVKDYKPEVKKVKVTANVK